ncbi:hypothetical protein N431DRAFT_466318 [Stipitochalara longipes BDJ]|nr:hypothetical protein N431DRAFT_466318 [Stipitochalara longipes BDJ]
MNGNTSSGVPAGWDGLNAMRPSPIAMENSSQPARKPRTQLPNNPIRRPIVVPSSTASPIRKPRRDSQRSQAKKIVQIMAISSLLNPAADREIEMSMGDSSEAELERMPDSSREDRAPLSSSCLDQPPAAASAVNPAVDCEVEMSMEDLSEQEPNGIPDSSSEEKYPLSLPSPIHTSAEASVSTAAAGKLVCKLCNGQYASKEILMRHIETAHARMGRITCQLCGSDFAKKQGLIMHQKSPTACKTFKCESCSQRFANQELLDSHTTLAHSHPKQKFVCTHCNGEYGAKDTLKYHIETRHDHLNRTVCAECDMIFQDKYALAKHQLSLTACMASKCESCSLRFASQELLESHVCLGSVTSTTEGKVVCPHCNVEYANRSKLEKHDYNVQYNSKRVPCPKCGKEFVQECLKKHLRSPTACKFFECKLLPCSRRFRSQELLAMHMSAAHSPSTSGTRENSQPAPTTGNNMLQALEHHLITSRKRTAKRYSGSQTCQTPKSHPQASLIQEMVQDQAPMAQSADGQAGPSLTPELRQRSRPAPSEGHSGRSEAELIALQTLSLLKKTLK